MSLERSIVLDTNTISGDADLLVLNPFQDTPIVTIQEFLALELL